MSETDKRLLLGTLFFFLVGILLIRARQLALGFLALSASDTFTLYRWCRPWFQRRTAARKQRLADVRK